jgi:[acyl-carrier-protein] S-malonyltransferase
VVFLCLNIFKSSNNYVFLPLTKNKDMKAYVFPGQGAQFSGMGKDLYEKSDLAKELFAKANEILGFDIQKIMFEGSDDELKQTKVTQPAIFLHSTILAACLGENFKPDMVAGHSLGEISALVANKTLKFEDGLKLVYKRALAMQKACEAEPSTMAAILGLEDKQVEDICEAIDGVVVAANYNCPGQLVISGSFPAVELACTKLTEAGAKRALILPVGGAFHSPLMEPAREELAAAIEETVFSQPICPVYQNVTASAVSSPDEIKKNLIIQLTAPVRWTQTMNQMIADGASEVVEVGPGKVLQGLFKKVDRSFPCSSAEI